MNAREVLEAALREADPDDAAAVVAKGLADPVARARALWAWTRSGELDTAASPRFWRHMAADPSAFQVGDLGSLLERIGRQPDCAGLVQRGRVLPAGWRKELDDLLRAVLPDAASLVATVDRLAEPMRGGLAWALAREGLLAADRVPARVLSETGLKVATGDFTVVREILESRQPWSRAQLAQAVAEAALHTDGRVDELQDLLALATPATQRQLFAKRGFGVLAMVVKAADATRTWLADHLDDLVKETEQGPADRLQRQAALEAWARVFPQGELPARFEPLVIEIASATNARFDALVMAISPGSRERVLLEAVDGVDSLRWLDAAALVPTSRVLPLAIDVARRDLEQAEAEPEFRSDLPDYVDEVAKKLSAFSSIAPSLEAAQAGLPRQSAAAKAFSRALENLPGR